MRRVVKRWMCRRRNGSLAEGSPPHHTKSAAGLHVWLGETVARVTIIYDDGRPSRAGSKRTKGGKRA